jgi:hypothetical protein
LLAPGAVGGVQKNQGSPVTVPSGLANALINIADSTVQVAINAVARRGESQGDGAVSG